MNFIVEIGAVVRIEKGRAGLRIRHERTETCGTCTACRSLGGDEFLLWVDAAGLKEGDAVRVRLPLPSPWRGIVLVFALPLAGLLAGVFVGGAWTGFQRITGLGSDWGALGLGMVLAAAAFAVALVEERRFSRRYQPSVIEVRPPS